MSFAFNACFVERGLPPRATEAPRPKQAARRLESVEREGYATGGSRDTGPSSHGSLRRLRRVTHREAPLRGVSPEPHETCAGPFAPGRGLAQEDRRQDISGAGILDGTRHRERACPASRTPGRLARRSSRRIKVRAGSTSVRRRAAGPSADQRSKRQRVSGRFGGISATDSGLVRSMAMIGVMSCVPCSPRKFWKPRIRSLALSAT